MRKQSRFTGALKLPALISAGVAFAFASSSYAAITLENEIPLTVNSTPNMGLYFNGVKKASTPKAESEPNVGPHQYDWMYGQAITPHGDCIKVYKNYVFMTWYRGGKQDRKLMLTRYNTETGSSATIEFPHRHTGYSNRWWVGETHNTIGIGLSPKDESIHMVFDQHSLSATNPSDGTAANDYFKYYYSKPNSLTVPDDQFTLDLFVKDDYFTGNDPINAYDNPNNETDEYKHITLTKEVNSNKFANLSYPSFSLTDGGDLYLMMRKGRSENGALVYNKYDGTKWFSSFRYFNYNQAKSRGNAYDYGVYGSMKYVGGKIRIGFQQRINNDQVKDRYKYQNGFFGAYIDDSDNTWKNYDDQQITFPLVNTDEVKISEPGEQVEGDEEARFSMVGGFDWNVTDRGDVHFIGKVTDTLNNNNATKHTYVHTYRPAGSDTFITSTDFSGADELYAAGNNIYIIGLSGGRPYVEKAEGGTNNFERIYAPTTGKTYSKGVPYIREGKLYYYLLEKTDAQGVAYTSDARPLYLQVIDLDLGPAEPALTVKFNKSSMTVDEGYQALSVKVDATTTVEGRTVEKVELFINEEFVQEATGHSYTWEASQSAELLGLPLGDHTLKAVVTDNAGDTSEATMTITVKTPPKPPTISFPDPELTVEKGYEQLTITLNVDTPEPDRTIVSVALKKDGEVIKIKTKPSWNFGHAYAPHEFGAMGWISCEQDPVPTPCHEPNPNPLDVGTHVFEAVAEDSEGLTSSAFLTLNVIEEGATVVPTDPTISFANTVTELTEGYNDFTVTVNAAATTDSATIANVALEVDGTPVSADDTAPYQWSDVALQGLAVGPHTLKAIVTDSNGDTAETTLQVTVAAAPEPTPVPTDPTISFANTVTELTEGYSDFTVTVNAAVTTDSATIANVALEVDGTPVSADDTAPYQWTGASLQGLAVGTHTIKAVVTDSNGLTAEATLQVTVIAAKIEPEPSDKDAEKSSGGGSMSIGLVLLLVLFRFMPQLKQQQK